MLFSRPVVGQNDRHPSRDQNEIIGGKSSVPKGMVHDGHNDVEYGESHVNYSRCSGEKSRLQGVIGKEGLRQLIVIKPREYKVFINP